MAAVPHAPSLIHGLVVKTNDRWYAIGAVSGTVVTAADSAIDHRTRTSYDRAGRATAVATHQGLTLIKTDKTFYDGHTTITVPQGGTASRTLTDARGRTIASRLYSTARSATVPDGSPATRIPESTPPTPSTRLAGPRRSPRPG